MAITRLDRNAAWPRQCGALLLVFGAAWAMPQSKFYGLTITGDRLLGLAAAGALVVLALGRRLRWTGVHTALGVFVAVQVHWLWCRDQGRRRLWVIASTGAIVFGLVFGLTRAAWLASAAIVVFWWRTNRPGWPRLATIDLLLAAALSLQAAVIGSSPVLFRVLRPLLRVEDANLRGRALINRATLASWKKRPLLGYGAGSTKDSLVLRRDGIRMRELWTANMTLFVLHDSGLLGLGALAALLAVVGLEVRHAARRGPGIEMPPVSVPLLASGAALLFAFQFTHALWLMYPYVYLGLLTSAIDDRAPDA